MFGYGKRKAGPMMGALNRFMGRKQETKEAAPETSTPPLKKGPRSFVGLFRKKAAKPAPTDVKVEETNG